MNVIFKFCPISLNGFYFSTWCLGLGVREGMYKLSIFFSQKTYYFQSSVSLNCHVYFLLYSVFKCSKKKGAQARAGIAA